MKANTISSRREGLSSPSSACLSATLIDRFEATASARSRRIVDLGQLDPGFGRKALVELRVILELVEDRAHQGLRFGAVSRLFVDLLDLGGHIAFPVDEIDQASALHALDQHSNGAVGQLQQLHGGGDDARGRKVHRGPDRPRPDRAARRGTVPCRRPSLPRARPPISRARRTEERCGAGRRRCREAAGSGECESWTSIWAALPSGATKREEHWPRAGRFTPQRRRHGRGQGEDQHRAQRGADQRDHRRHRAGNSRRCSRSGRNGASRRRRATNKSNRWPRSSDRLVPRRIHFRWKVNDLRLLESVNSVPVQLCLLRMGA